MAVKGYTYFVQAEEGGPIKIGYTATTPDQRLKALQTGSPLKLRMLLAVRGNREHEFHQRFASIRQHGEWFENAKALLEFIEAQRTAMQPEKTTVELDPRTLQNSDPEYLFDVKFDVHEGIFDFHTWVHRKERVWAPNDSEDYNPWKDESLTEDEQCEYYHTCTADGIMDEIAWLMDEASFFEAVWISTERKIMLFQCGPCNSGRREELLSDLAYHVFDMDFISSPWQFVATTWINGKHVGVELVLSQYGRFVLFDVDQFFSALAKGPPE